MQSTPAITNYVNSSLSWIYCYRCLNPKQADGLSNKMTGLYYLENIFRSSRPDLLIGSQINMDENRIILPIKQIIITFQKRLE